MGIAHSMSVWTYTLSATLVVLILNIQAPGTWQSWASFVFVQTGVTGNAQLAVYFLDILVVGVAFTVGQYNVRRIRKSGENRGYARAVSEGHRG